MPSRSLPREVGQASTEMEAVKRGRAKRRAKDSWCHKTMWNAKLKSDDSREQTCRRKCSSRRTKSEVSCRARTERGDLILV